MTDLLVAVAVFIVAHLIPAARPVRGELVRRMGERAYVVAYTVFSLALLAWLALAYARAPYIEVWEFRPWMRWVPLLVMPLACVLLVGAVVAPNPLSVAVRRDGFDPARPGVVGITRHPLVWGLVLWSIAHLVPNGDAASLVLFGLLGGLGLVGPVSLDHKQRARLGEAEWRCLAVNAPNLPFSGRRRPSVAEVGAPVLVGGIVLYVGLLLAHQWVIGVSPLPF